MLKKASELIMKSDDEAIPSLSFAFLFKNIFKTLPPPDPTDLCHINANSLRLVYLCCCLSKQVYVAPAEREFPSSISDLIYESQESKLYQIPYFVTDSDAVQTIFLTLRGSYCFNDFLVDLKAAASEFMGGYVHQGAFKTALEMYPKVTPMLLQLSAQKNNRRILITGHSLGAGVACILTEMLHKDYPALNVTCICFAPVAEFSANLVENSKYRITSFVVHGDFVPFLSLHNACILPPDSLPLNFNKYMKGYIKKYTASHSYSPKIIPHSTNPFLEPPPSYTQIAYEEPPTPSEPPPLYPPGHCYEFNLIDEKENIIELRKIKTYEYFGHFNNDLNEFRHMMGVYKTWIEGFCKNFEQKTNIKVMY